MPSRSSTDRNAPDGIGLGLRGKFIDALCDGALDEIDHHVAFLEVAPENYMRRGGAVPRQLAQLAERFPTITHGLMMSLGSTDPLRDDYFAALRPFLDRYAAPWHSDHLCFAGLDGALLHDLLPLPHTGASARRVARRIQEASDRLERPMAVENISYYVHMGAPELSEPQFVRAVAEEADCGILLDVNNVIVNGKNLGIDPRAWIAEIPLERVVQLHVAGHERWDRFDMWVDTHGAPAEPLVYDLMAEIIAKTGPLPVVLERDSNIPPLPELVDEVGRLHARYEAAVTQWRADRAQQASSAGEHRDAPR